MNTFLMKYYRVNPNGTSSYDLISPKMHHKLYEKALQNDTTHKLCSSSIHCYYVPTIFNKITYLKHLISDI